MAATLFVLSVLAVPQTVGLPVLCSVLANLCRSQTAWVAQASYSLQPACVLDLWTRAFARYFNDPAWGFFCKVGSTEGFPGFSLCLQQAV